MKFDVIEKDIRCPVGKKLFMKLLMQKREGPIPVVEGNLMEFHCDLCSKYAREKDSSIIRVVHRFDILGNFIETAAKK